MEVFVNSKRLWFVVTITLLVAASSLFGQGGGTVEGTISDPSGAVIPGATVTARNVETGVETKRVSNASGIYVLALSPGRYNIEASAAGFQMSRNRVFDCISVVRVIVELQISIPADFLIEIP